MLGRRVVGESIFLARTWFPPVCRFCKRGLKTHCARRTVLGILGHDGAFAEYLSLPLESLHRVPSMSAMNKRSLLSLSRPLAKSSHKSKLRTFALRVLGDGKLAQLIARVLRTRLPRVVMYGKHRKNFDWRESQIDTEMVHGDERDHEKLRDSYSLIVEATGSPTGLRLAQEMTEPRGTLISKSTFHGAAPVETWPRW